MRRLGALLALALVACAGGREPTSSPKATTPTVTTPTVTMPAAGRGALVYVAHDELFTLDPRTQRATSLAKSSAEVLDLAVSADGGFAAFVVHEPTYAVTVVDLASRRSRAWTAPKGAVIPRLIAAGTGFVGVDVAGDALLRFDPATVLAGDAPTTIVLRGVTEARLLAASGNRVLVTTREDASAYGGPETVHDVAADGTTRRLFQDGDTRPEGDVSNLPMGPAALNADGTRLVYGTGATAGALRCDAGHSVVVRDLVANRELDAPGPPVPDEPVLRPATVTFDARGRAVVGFSSDGLAPSGRCDRGRRRGAAYVLEGLTWRELVPNATWAAEGPGGEVAAILADGSLSVDRTVITAAVTFAAWAPPG